VRTLAVFQSPGKPLFLLNELEWIKGEIWANIWHSEQLETETTQGTMPNIGRPNMIARIDPTTGNVVGWVDLSGISPGDQPSTTDPEAYREDPKAENTLNGIAYDATNDRIFVTGKRWKKLYEIRIKPKE
jgi:glutaminyl-peptide cyclotransferase